MTRALTLGRAASSAAILAPADGATLAAAPGAAAADLVFDLAIDAFNVGREGSWCLVASVGGMLTCVLQNHLTLVLRVEPPDGCDLDVAFRVELKSNVYGDVVAASDEVRVALPRRRPADPAAGPPPPPRAYAATEFLVWPYRPGCPD